MTDVQASTVEREVRIEARPETIFPFFTEPELMVRWMGRTVDLDARPGGAHRIEVTGERVAAGEYVEVSPPERVVFTWGWETQDSPVRPGSSTVTVTLTPDGNHTVVKLVHSDLPGDGAAAGHGEGWDHYLPRLAIAATGGDAGPDPWASPDTP